MPISDAKLSANRKNVALSTGPRTTEGKERIRKNTLKHGLTGLGVALPSEDQDEINERFIEFQTELKPKTDAGSQLVRRFAFLSVRLKRCERHDTKETAKRVRHAIAKFDDERLAAVEVLFARLYHEPATTSRRLQMTPEGIDWLLDEWEVLRHDLNHPDPKRWNDNHRSHFDALLGRNSGGYRVARIFALSQAMAGFCQYLDPGDAEGLEGQAQSDWARGELTRLIDVEMERLKAARIKLDPDALAEDRAEAVDRALFDVSPESILARRYEAATERAMYKALKEYRQVEADAAAGRESAITPYTIKQSEPVGLNYQETDDEETEADPEESPDPESVDFEASHAAFLNISIGRAPETGPKPTEQIGAG